MLKNVFVVAAKRTPFGKFGGKLKDLSATDLQVIANKAAIEQSKLSADKIDTVIVGNILPSSIGTYRFLKIISDFRNCFWIIF
jgi:acetyl-CoA acetyltransferase